MKPRLISAIPKLASLDLQRSLQFYERLGFSRAGDFHDYGIVVHGAVQIHLWVCTDPRIPKETACRVVVSGIDALYASYQALGVVHPNGQLARKPYGVVEFSVLDPDGNLITFQQDAD